MEEMGTPSTVTVRRNPPRRARPTPVNLASSTVSAIPTVSTFPLADILSPIHAADSESLKVFLRVRPAGIRKTKKSKLNSNGSSMKNCIEVKDSHSVAVTPPACASGRSKSEVYRGFSHVFSPASSQDEVYDTLMRPLVHQFLHGRSALLAALGPTGSGKTHTVFGSDQHPGLLPRALRHIFHSSSSSFYLSVFEICLIKGKGEKLCDLSPDGGHIQMQQSTVKGLKQVLIKDVAQAEAILAAAMLKRATAFTNSNAHSSRSQCIINIRSSIEGDTDTDTDTAADLTFVDLAGAERESKTGNQGGRLIESNFINNTSMVFGLCLRSLLEHQKNPKKPLHKHFQSSLLTRYLRDYLEGRKRMALILTARSGPEDYFDTSFLLRQASPFMEIKFNNMEENSKLLGNKRPNQVTCNDNQKRVKLSDDQKDGVGGTTRDSGNSTNKDISNEVKDNSMLEATETAVTEVNCTNAKLQRDYYVMQGFAKALWNVLKQYKEKVKVMQNEINLLAENISTGRDQYSAMEKELQNLKSRCLCPRLPQKLETSFLEAGSGEIQDPGATDVCELHLANSTPTTETFAFADPKTENDAILRKPFQGDVLLSQDVESCVQQDYQRSARKGEILYNHGPIVDCHDKDSAEKIGKMTKDAVAHFPKSEVVDLNPQRENIGDSIGEKIDNENAACCPRSNFNPKLEPKEISHNPLKFERPKRRLMPASSLLLRDAGSFDISDDNVNHKGGKGGRRLTEDQCKRTRGSASLLLLLKNHLPR